MSRCWHVRVSCGSYMLYITLLHYFITFTFHAPFICPWFTFHSPFICPSLTFQAPFIHLWDRLVSMFAMKKNATSRLKHGQHVPLRYGARCTLPLANALRNVLHSDQCCHYEPCFIMQHIVCKKYLYNQVINDSSWLSLFGSSFLFRAFGPLCPIYNLRRASLLWAGPFVENLTVVLPMSFDLNTMEVIGQLVAQNLGGPSMVCTPGWRFHMVSLSETIVLGMGRRTPPAFRNLFGTTPPSIYEPILQVQRHDHSKNHNFVSLRFSWSWSSGISLGLAAECSAKFRLTNQVCLHVIMHMLGPW